MSKPNLPELPSLGSCVVNEACWKFIENLPHTIPGPMFNDLKSAVYAALCHALPDYAEEAVRQALAAQEVRAWLIRDRKNGTDPMFTIAKTTEPFASTYWPLAIIPETSPGHKPAPVDTSSGHCGAVADIENYRTDFEGWASDKGFCLDCAFFVGGNNYMDDDTRLAFDIWIAARSGSKT